MTIGPQSSNAFFEECLHAFGNGYAVKKSLAAALLFDQFIKLLDLVADPDVEGVVL